MPAQVIDGKAIAARVRAEVREEVDRLRERGVVPGLHVVLVGDDPASHVYVRNKGRACEEVGIAGVTHRLPAETPEADVLALVRELNASASVDGILVQLPVPRHIDPQKVTHAVDPQKDVDGYHPASLGALVAGLPGLVSCTPAGCLRLIDETGTNLAGKRAVVVGRSVQVGKPMALLLMARNATVTVCHSRTVDLAERVREAEVLVAAIGRAEMVKGDWIRPGAVVIDVGINRNAEGKMVGDVEFAAAAERAAWITPVPGGVGPMTIAYLLKNTVAACKARRGL